MQDDEDTISNIIHRKTAFIDDRKRSLGPEYYSNKPFWDRMWEQEWEQFELHSQNRTEFTEDMDIVPMVFPQIEYKDKMLNLYSYSDFTMLHNQGIFRATTFFIDRSGNWTKKVIKEMRTYGYEYLQTIEKHLLFESDDE
jgi:hypothetical protein|tara:strand:+ start:201 stop:620 length:420 start_codon:yes stop_codon:yes gene_type:complete